MTSHTFTGLEAIAQSQALGGAAVFPVSGRKTPIMQGSWRDYSTPSPERILQLWQGRSFHLAVDVGKSSLLVFDQDRVLPDGDPVKAMLDDAGSLVLASLNRQMPHYYFLQGQEALGNSVWSGGDVKGHGGYVVVSRHHPIHNGPILVAPRGLTLERARVKPKGGHTSGGIHGGWLVTYDC